MRSARETAVLLALLFKNAEMNRARVSKLTFKKISGRKNVRSAFVVDVTEKLSNNYGLYLIELDSGGFGMVPAKSLEAAKPITAKKFLPGIINELRKGEPLDFAELEEELMEGEEGDDLDSDE
ncbi:hypothetical protein D3C76_1314140 [compost metagenome]|nr:hypothetical protein [Pseudomonas putida]MDY4320777.1 hypothetical protein [Pseudomonas putida]MDY4354124.1 hypothetical protein [Pseudomonas putida]